MTENKISALLQPIIPFSQISLHDIEAGIEKGMSVQNDNIQKIIENRETPTFENTIVALENSDELLNRASSLLFNLSSAETNKQLDDLVSKLAPQLTAHSHAILNNEKLFNRISTLYHQLENESLKEEDRMLLNDSYKVFKRNGALLSKGEQEKLGDISSRLSVLTVKFSQNHLSDLNDFTLNITDEKQIEGLPEIHKNAAARRAKEAGKEGWLFTLQYPSFGPFMKFIHDRSLRKKMYVAFNTLCTHDNDYNNLAIVKEIVDLRRQKAQILGYPTYADYVLEERMAKSVKRVNSLFSELKENYFEKAKEDVREIAKEAATDGIDDLKPWDFAFYSHRLYKRTFQLDTEKLRPYFEVQNVKKGIFNLAKSLYGVTFNRNEKIDLYHPDVEAYDVLEADGQPLGVFYLDLYPRAGKQSGAWMTSYVEGDALHLPSVSIVTNFTSPTDDAPALLSLDEVNTFLHEFGHALHGLFGTSSYKSLSGTNVDRDFVELPSQFMENFLYEKDFLNTFAFHYQTGEVIPENVIEILRKSKTYNAAYACMRQLSFGILDMAYHTLDSDLHDDVIDFEHRLWEDIALLPTPEFACMSTQFDHIMAGGYAAGYYSYKWSEILDADAFSYFQEKGIFSKSAANDFRTKILNKGGTVDPDVLFADFRGRGPSIKPLMMRDGIIENKAV